MSVIAVKASGLVTSVGFNAASSFAAMRAGIRSVKETNLWDPESGQYLSAGRVMLPHWWIGVGKMADLVAPAIFECLNEADHVPLCDIPVLLGVASHEQPFRLEGLNENILEEIEYRIGSKLNQYSQVISNDHISVATGLEIAQKLIGDRKVRFCIIAAVDSLIRQDLKNYYLEKRRLLTENNSNGFCVGEAGSAILVTSSSSIGDNKLEILGTGYAIENSTIESEEPVRAQGLTEAVRKAFTKADVTIQELDYRIADLNGEHYKAKEMTLAMGRFPRRPTSKLFDIWHPIEFIGDVGAAIGPILLGWALHAGQRDYGIGNNVLCTLGNDTGERVAIILKYTTPVTHHE